MTLLCIQSHYGQPGAILHAAGTRPDAEVIDQTELTSAHLARADALVTTMHLDQLGMMEFAADLEAFLDRGGRWFLNGHIMRPLVAGLSTYQPIVKAGRADLLLIPLNDHPVFTKVNRAGLGARKGVAGFYGRGHNPLPEGALPVTGIGPDYLPVDWEWHRPGGGVIFSHAGNDLPGTAESDDETAQLAANVVNWCLMKTEEVVL